MLDVHLLRYLHFYKLINLKISISWREGLREEEKTAIEFEFLFRHPHPASPVKGEEFGLVLNSTTLSLSP